jgi:hypothetical protein
VSDKKKEKETKNKKQKEIVICHSQTVWPLAILIGDTIFQRDTVLKRFSFSNP